MCKYSYVDDPNQTTVQYKQVIHHGELEAMFQQAQTQTHKLTHSHLHDSEEINTLSKFFWNLKKSEDYYRSETQDSIALWC